MSASARDISKRFGDLQALRDVDLDVAQGRLHALLGANGSGKSTLSKCLCGVYAPDAGTITIGKSDVARFHTPADAHAAGVRVVHQDSPLLLSLSVLENFAVAHGYPSAGALAPVRWRSLRRDVEASLERFHVPIKATALAGELTAAQRGMIALVLALDDLDEGGVELLILDEVTAHIPESDALELLDQVKRIPEMGISVLMVTHRFKEVSTYADDATILSDGVVVHSGPASDLDIGQLVDYMTATKVTKGVVAASADERPDDVAALAVEGLADIWRREGLPSPGEGVAIQVTDLVGAEIDGLSFAVKPGEIIGIAGLPESGVNELPAMLTGLTNPVSGEIVVDGTKLRGKPTPADAIELGVMCVPRDRHAEGGAMSLTVGENMTLPQAGRFWHKRRQEKRVVRRFIDAFDVRPAREDVLLGALSGGNQQKVVIAKWLIAQPKILILDNPTAGVDPAARRQLFDIFHDAAANGLALIIFSSEPEQFAEHCSRVLVLREGKIAGELSGTNLEAETINQKVTSLSS
jgi:ribose transport system ATP-binding protein